VQWRKKLASILINTRQARIISYITLIKTTWATFRSLFFNKLAIALFLFRSDRFLGFILCYLGKKSSSKTKQQQILVTFDSVVAS
jgi:hypothetical protein